jgi:hypothetical protein
LPSEEIAKAEFKEGEELDIYSKKGEIKLLKKGRDKTTQKRER